MPDWSYSEKVRPTKDNARGRLSPVRCVGPRSDLKRPGLCAPCEIRPAVRVVASLMVKQCGGRSGSRTHDSRFPNPITEKLLDLSRLTPALRNFGHKSAHVGCGQTFIDFPVPTTCTRRRLTD